MSEEKIRKEILQLPDIKFVYFDIGGVLYGFRSGLQRLAKLMSIPYEQCEQLWVQFDDDVCRGKLKPQDLWTKMKSAFGYTGADINFIDFWVSHFQPIQETHKLVQQLATNYAVGLFTNIYPGAYELALEKKKLPNIEYASVIKSCDVGLVKPEAAIYQLAEEKAGVRPNEILFIDDNIRYTNAATQRRWNTILFNRKNPTASTSHISGLLKKS
jgi:FMN phosphatase YigB (HAD superfamily)